MWGPLTQKQLQPSYQTWDEKDEKELGKTGIKRLGFVAVSGTHSQGGLDSKMLAAEPRGLGL